jgi:hypothetical protein
VSYKRDTNIKDILAHRKHNLQFYGKENGCKAWVKNCALCSHIIEARLLNRLLPAAHDYFVF